MGLNPIPPAPKWPEPTWPDPTIIDRRAPLSWRHPIRAWRHRRTLGRIARIEAEIVRLDRLIADGQSSPFRPPPLDEVSR